MHIYIYIYMCVCVCMYVYVYITLLDEFEKDLYGIVTSQRNVNNTFKEKLKSDISNIRLFANTFIFAGKTNNIYEIKPQDLEKLIMENITKTY